jgi:hypothetical protein
MMNSLLKPQTQLASNTLHRFSTITGPVKLLGSLVVCMAFVASVQAQANVTLAWNPIADPLVAGFNVYYGGASGVYTNEINAGTNTSVTISNMTIGATYYFASTTYSAAGAESALSPEVSYTVPPPPAVSPPPAVQLTVASAQQFNLTVTGLNGHNYDIQASQDLVNWTVIGTVTLGTGGSTTFTDTNAANFSSRFYRTLDIQP